MTDFSGSNLAHCTYSLLDNDIHELVFRNQTPAAVNEFFSILNHLYDGKTRRDPTLRLLVDASNSGIPPMTRIMPGAKTLVARHPDRPEVRYAFLLPRGSSQVISTLETFIRLFRPTNKVRSFNASGRAVALRWLVGK